MFEVFLLFLFFQCRSIFRFSPLWRCIVQISWQYNFYFLLLFRCFFNMSLKNFTKLLLFGHFLANFLNKICFFLTTLTPFWIFLPMFKQIRISIKLFNIKFNHFISSKILITKVCANNFSKRFSYLQEILNCKMSRAVTRSIKGCLECIRMINSQLFPSSYSWCTWSIDWSTKIAIKVVKVMTFLGKNKGKFLAQMRVFWIIAAVNKRWLLLRMSMQIQI